MVTLMHVPTQQTVEETQTTSENQTMTAISDTHITNVPTPYHSSTDMMLESIQVGIEEISIQEIDMIEAETTQEEEVVVVILHDIKDISDYTIRNRVAQPSNPFFIV